MRHLSTTLGVFLTSCSVFLAGCGGAAAPTTPAARTASPARPTSAACESRPLDAAWVHRLAAARVVRVLTQGGAGSGFVIGDGAEQLVVTNYHVVASGDRYTAEIAAGSGASRRVALDLVKIDREQDLALLKPSVELGVAGLELRNTALATGESIVLLGYPSASDTSFELTLEPGSVTAARREVGGAVRVQTNANINPGNSGGPMLDGCGRVTGVVTSRHLRAERTGFAVPVEALERLVVAAREPRLAPEVEARARVEEFLKAVRLRDNARAAGFFGREFLVRAVQPVLTNALKSAEDKSQGAAAEAPRGPALLSKLLSTRLTPAELSALDIRAAVKEGRLVGYAAPEAFLAVDAAEILGDIQQAWVETLSVKPKGCIEAGVTVHGKDEFRRYVLHLHDRFGEWVIDGVKRVR